MNNLKEARKAKHLTQTDVAKYIGLSQSAYSDWERGISNIDSASLNRLAELFGVSIDYLMGNKEKETPLVNGDPELTAYLEELRTRPEMRMLFDVTKDATLEDVQTAVKIIEALRGKPDVDT